MTTERPAVTVHDAEARRSYVAVLDDGTEAGYAEYRRADGVVTFTSTEVPGAFEGRGIGSALVRGALDDARARGEQVVARCPFVAAYLDRHPEYADLLGPSRQ